MNGYFGDRAIVKIVRLAIETNLMTSKPLPLTFARQPFSCMFQLL